MAKIIAGVATSHVPAIGAALDNGKTQRAYWRALFDGYEFSKKWIAETKPDVVHPRLQRSRLGVLAGSDSRPSRSAAPRNSPPADEGWGPRPVPVVKGHPELAWHIAQSLILDEFDMTIVNKMDVDHGLTVPLSLMYGQPKEWPCKVIPLASTSCSIRRRPAIAASCWARRSARRSRCFPQDLRVVIFGTGGMSHQLQGPRAGLINKEFDNRFLDNYRRAIRRRWSKIPHIEYVREAAPKASSWSCG